MNLLILPPYGGSYNSLRPEIEIYIGLAKAGHNITIITNTEKEHVSHYYKHGIDVIPSPPKKKLSLTSIKLIRSIIKSKNIDIVYATNSRTIPNSAFACIGTKTKLVVYRGTTGGLYRRDPSTYLSILNPRVNGVICVSKAVEKYVKKRVWSSVKNNVTTIYKGHDLDWYNNTPTDLEQFGTNSNNFNVACVANARPHKGLIYVIKAARKLADLKNVHILLVGEKISKEPYVSAIKESCMEERIHVTGYRHDAPEIIAASDVLIMPSIREGLPRVVLESLAYGTPVITSANEGSMEIIDDGVNGYVVPLRNGDAIADRVRHLHDHPDKLAKLASHSQDKLKSELSSEQTIKNHEKYFKSLLNN